ncbi:VOC family protein [Rhizobium helianthi]|uniref:VOC family protein n=1 Tax=Rhizobium helianthi TaxID=1132695 RepID=A0ABW4LZI5_9HYPH
MSSSLDHLVLPVESLGRSRGMFSRLGFTVAPDGHHPFGTSNACVFFCDQTYLEPLAIRDMERAGEAAGAGNVFAKRHLEVAMDERWHAPSAFVLASSNADADHARFESRGISAGPVLNFSREAQGADGSKRTASFRLAFADLGSKELLGFTCQRINAALPGGSLLNHENTAQGIAEVLLIASDFAKDADRLALVLGDKGCQGEAEWTFQLQNGALRLLAFSHALTAFGASSSRSQMVGLGVTIAVKSLAAAEACLIGNEIPHTKLGRMLVVSAQPGVHPMLAFVEIP